jgi:hypothetical protein
MSINLDTILFNVNGEISIRYLWIYLLNRNGEREPREDNEEEGGAVVAGDMVAVHPLHCQLKSGKGKLKRWNKKMQNELAYCRPVTYVAKLNIRKAWKAATVADT